MFITKVTLDKKVPLNFRSHPEPIFLDLESGSIALAEVCALRVLLFHRRSDFRTKILDRELRPFSTLLKKAFDIRLAASEATKQGSIHDLFDYVHPQHLPALAFIAIS